MREKRKTSQCVTVGNSGDWSKPQCSWPTSKGQPLVSLSCGKADPIWPDLLRFYENVEIWLFMWNFLIMKTCVSQTNYTRPCNASLPPLLWITSPWGQDHALLFIFTSLIPNTEAAVHSLNGLEEKHVILVSIQVMPPRGDILSQPMVIPQCLFPYVVYEKDPWLLARHKIKPGIKKTSPRTFLQLGMAMWLISDQVNENRDNVHNF